MVETARCENCHTPNEIEFRHIFNLDIMGKYTCRECGKKWHFGALWMEAGH